MFGKRFSVAIASAPLYAVMTFIFAVSTTSFRVEILLAYSRSTTKKQGLIIGRIIS